MIPENDETKELKVEHKIEVEAVSEFHKEEPKDYSDLYGYDIVASSFEGLEKLANDYGEFNRCDPSIPSVVLKEEARRQGFIRKIIAR